MSVASVLTSVLHVHKMDVAREVIRACSVLWSGVDFPWCCAVVVVVVGWSPLHACMIQRCCVSVLVSSDFATALKRLRMVVESCSDAVSQVNAVSTWLGVLKLCVSLMVGKLVCSWWVSVVLVSFLMVESWVRAVCKAVSKSCFCKIQDNKFLICDGLYWKPVKRN